MSDWIRLFTTAMIWGMVAIMVTTSRSESVPLAFILGVGATISTLAIWNSANKKSNQATLEIEKNKRRSRVSRLLDEVDQNLDEEEVYELEELLAARRDDAIRRRSQ